MSLIYEKVSYNPGSSLIARWNKDFYFSTPLHFHDEYEIIYVVKSYGIKYIGDARETFNEGDLVLLGSKLPHTYSNNEIFTNNKANEKVKAVIIQFGEDLYQLLSQRPECRQIIKMLDDSQRGIHFSTEISKQSHDLLLHLPEIKDDFTRFISIMQLLQQLATSNNYHLLASLSYNKVDKDNSLSRITDTIKYISENYQNKLTLNEIARQFNMGTTAFCNFFKRKTGNTLINYINELRVSQACKLLNYSDKRISEIAFECGFNNLSNFNRIFKSITNFTPKEYRKLWTKEINSVNP